MATNYKSNKDEKKKPMSAKERYEAYLERDRKLNEMLEGISDEDLSNVDMSNMSAKERYAVYNARKAQKEAEANKIDETEEEIIDETAPLEEPKPYYEIDEDELTSDGEKPAEGEEVDGEAAEGEEGDGEEGEKEQHMSGASHGGSTGTEEDMAKRAFIRRIIFSLGFAIAAIALQLITFHVPFTPANFRIDFSALPELLASIAYGPITGIIVVIVKNILYMLINHNIVATAISNTILDSIFVTIAGLLYSKSVFMKAKSKKRLPRKQAHRRMFIARAVNIFGGGIIGGLVTSALSIIILNYVTLPIIFRKYPKEEYVAQLISDYQKCLDGINHYLPGFLRFVTEIHSVLQGTLIFNFEVTFMKYAFVTVLTAIVYPIFSDFLHYRK